MNTPRPSARTLAHPQGSAAEERLWAAYGLSGSNADREALFRHYQPLARRMAASMVRREAPTPVDFEELFQLACTGLLESLDRFKPELGVPFRYFASRRINGAILNGIAQHSEINRQISTRRRMERERLTSLADGQAQPGTLDDALGLLGNLAAGLALGLMIEELREAEGGGADPAKSAFETVAWKQMVKLVETEIAQLAQRDQDIMRWHYLDGLPFDHIAKILRLSKGRVSQLHSAAIALLRKRLLKVGQFRIEG